MVTNWRQIQVDNFLVQQLIQHPNGNSYSDENYEKIVAVIIRSENYVIDFRQANVFKPFEKPKEYDPQNLIEVSVTLLVRFHSEEILRIAPIAELKKWLVKAIVLKTLQRMIEEDSNKSETK